MKIKLYFKWFDLRVGFYIDGPNRAVYICPLPTIGVKISFPCVTLRSPPDATCEICKRPLDVAHAHWLGEWEGWHASWNCRDRCGCGVVMEFPFPDKTLVTVVDFEQAGFVIS